MDEQKIFVISKYLWQILSFVASFQLEWKDYLFFSLFFSLLD